MRKNNKEVAAARKPACYTHLVFRPSPELLEQHIPLEGLAHGVLPPGRLLVLMIGSLLGRKLQETGPQAD